MQHDRTGMWLHPTGLRSTFGLPRTNNYRVCCPEHHDTGSHWHASPEELLRQLQYILDDTAANLNDEQHDNDRLWLKVSLVRDSRRWMEQRIQPLPIVLPVLEAGTQSG